MSLKIEDKEGMLWIGTAKGGLNRFDKETGRSTIFKHNPDKTQSIGSDSIIDIYEDGFNNLWIGKI